MIGDAPILGCSCLPFTSAAASSPCEIGPTPHSVMPGRGGVREVHISSPRPSRSGIYRGSLRHLHSLVALLSFLIVATIVPVLAHARECPTSNNELVEAAIIGDITNVSCFLDWPLAKLTDNNNHVDSAVWALGSHSSIVFRAALKELDGDNLTLAFSHIFRDRTVYKPSQREMDEYKALLESKSVATPVKSWIFGGLAGLTNAPDDYVRNEDELVWAYVKSNIGVSQARFMNNGTQLCTINRSVCVDIGPVRCPPASNIRDIVAVKLRYTEGVLLDVLCPKISKADSLDFVYYFGKSSESCQYVAVGNLYFGGFISTEEFDKCYEVMIQNYNKLDFVSLDVVRNVFDVIRLDLGKEIGVPGLVISYLKRGGYVTALRLLCEKARC